MESPGNRMSNGQKCRRTIKFSAVKMKFLRSINLKELILELFSLLGVPTELEIGEYLDVSSFSMENVAQAEKLLQDMLCERKLPIGVECFRHYEWQLLKNWLNRRFKESGQRVQASVVQNGDTDTFEIELVGFKDCFTQTESEMLDFLQGKVLCDGSLTVGSRDLLRFKDLECVFPNSPFHVELKLWFDLKAPAILFRGPRVNVEQAKSLVDKLLYKEAVSAMSPRTKQGNELPFHLTGDTTLSLCKNDSRKLLPNVDVLISLVKEGRRCIEDTKEWKGFSAKNEFSMLGEAQRHAVQVLLQTQTSSVGRFQRVISLVALLKRSNTSERGVGDLVLVLREALGFALEFAEREQLSSVAICGQKIESDLLSKLDYINVVVDGLHRHCCLHPFTILKSIVFNSDDDEVMSMFFRKCLARWRLYGSAQRDVFPGSREGSNIQMEIATGAIEKEKEFLW
ncbi:uncharacterized protein [Pleurodeles waltl]|uniref:uncharacterized protein n=1 Tax=Pleurodeles waltl TaxID=8319 RepID=UPI0037098CCC